MREFSKLRCLLNTLSIFFISMTCACRGFSATGRVGVLVDGRYDYQTVELEPSDSPVELSNAWIRIKSDAQDLNPDKSGCYCFTETDPRFSVVQAYYQGTKELQLFDEALQRQGLHALKKVVVTLNPTFAENPPSGVTFQGRVTFYLSPKGPLDETLFAHEIGHVLHLSFTGDLYSYSSEEENTNIMGVRERMANILSALFTDESRIGIISYGDGMRDVNRFFHFPDQIFTLRDDEQRVERSIFIRDFYPVAYEKEKTSPVFKLDQNSPEPYGTSSLFTQPLWLASQKFGREAILDLIISAIHANPLQRSYQKLASDLVKAAKGNPQLQDFLFEDFQQRGIQ
jgi:hypothetical protein